MNSDHHSSAQSLLQERTESNTGRFAVADLWKQPNNAEGKHKCDCMRPESHHHLAPRSIARWRIWLPQYHCIWKNHVGIRADQFVNHAQRRRTCFAGRHHEWIKIFISPRSHRSRKGLDQILNGSQCRIVGRNQIVQWQSTLVIASG